MDVSWAPCRCAFTGRPVFWAQPWMRRQSSLRGWSPITASKKRLAVYAEKASRLSYDDPARSYAHKLMREEVQLATETPSVIQLMEAMEGICLLAALALQLIPVLYTIFAQKSQSTQQISSDTSATAAASETAVEDPAVVQEVESAGRVSAEVQSQSMLGGALSSFSFWSASLLIVGVVLGSGIRRFRQNQLQLHQSLSPAAATHLSQLEHDEMEESLTRAFAEISHLASQVEKLRIKVAVISRDYTSTLEKSNTQSSKLKKALHEVLAQLKGTEDKIQNLNDIMAKMQGFASKQFMVVSSALRRMDGDCKALATRLPAPVEKSESTILEETAATTTTAAPQQMDLHS